MTILEDFHGQVRLAGREDEPREGLVMDTDGPVRRTWSQDPTKFAMVECPAGLEDDPDHWISRQMDFFAQRGQEFEWKTYDYDEPADLLGRLRDKGFAVGGEEALVLGEVADLVGAGTEIDPGVRIRRIGADDAAAFAGIESLTEVVWGLRDGHAAELRTELTLRPDTVDVYVAEDLAGDAGVVCAAWVRYTSGTDFASLWGGSTHPQFRWRGIYRALVAERARRATERGFPFVRVDCTPDSLPILTRLGLRREATTVPATFTPSRRL